MKSSERFGVASLFTLLVEQRFKHDYCKYFNTGRYFQNRICLANIN
ncbi:hypothetical protein H1P_130053 [Hyella patelloides LEGE 07179]|uniref:Uncharacterized protein n=1 Tax=Hyella patelloides LEGE 07179 TaxID=945734 RepID=A0A563VL24_9CYAN|nr:hypothetical protein H1P_130053 [Hyella patelloides LEGE 07179]